ncbi:TIGR00282 family metallophosphoesterase [Jeotgalibacillus proteolyticus]|uniref:TIGR00282 family metallophosphoesterase n=1 Tax=Jeotgalibacillus proteolyticus TaxID=2082395 RepID=A0A2S5GGK1_9BACL|nr:TIGR00282 family metallophosphoesterase [Jeotgalibacillus proteolyticus]PPA71993.1 TIGR00282 family metallophosphoesterase [Jeotgalibacillus proteolyticus]
MRILFIGDIVGSPGREMVEEYLPQLKEKYSPDCTIINGENAASGRGITEKIYRQLESAGGEVFTLGNHTWDNREIFQFIDQSHNMVRPANYPKGAPGKGMQIISAGSSEIAIINALGRTFMNPVDDPFPVVKKLVEEAKRHTPFIFVDFHAEATSEKQAMGWFLDGKASAVVGTHTHVQTSDNRILPGGTAYLSDVGMTGPYDAILGMEKEAVLKRFTTGLPSRFEVPKTGRAILSGCLIDLDRKSGKAVSIERILINEDHPFVSN